MGIGYTNVHDFITPRLFVKYLLQILFCKYYYIFTYCLFSKEPMDKVDYLVETTILVGQKRK